MISNFDWWTKWIGGRNSVWEILYRTWRYWSCHQQKLVWWHLWEQWEDCSYPSPDSQSLCKHVTIVEFLSRESYPLISHQWEWLTPSQSVQSHNLSNLSSHSHYCGCMNTCVHYWWLTCWTTRRWNLLAVWNHHCWFWLPEFPLRVLLTSLQFK